MSVHLYLHLCHSTNRVCSRSELSLTVFCAQVEGHPSLQTLKLSNTGPSAQQPRNSHLDDACSRLGGAMDIKSCLARVLRNSCLQATAPVCPA